MNQTKCQDLLLWKPRTLREIIFPFQETTFVCCDATSWRNSKTVAFKNNDYVIFIQLVLLNRAVKIIFLLGKS